MQYDFFILNAFNYLKQHNFKITRWVIDSQRFIVHAKNQDRSMIFVDTLNYVKYSLKDIGKVVGFEKLEIDFSKCTLNELITYCKRDVEILKRFVLELIKFVKYNDLGSFKPTIAGLAFNAFRHRFMTEKIFIHQDPRVQELEIESYRGGRNECFFIGEYHGKVYYLDINSMYPYVMRSFPFPCRLEKLYYCVKPQDYKMLAQNYLTIARCRVDVIKPVVGIKYNNKLTFPVGIFSATLTKPEIELVNKYGSIIRFDAVACYKPAPLFVNYVEYFHELKQKYTQENNPVFRALAKLYLNSLYGKFGQRITKYTLIAENCQLEDGIYNWIDSKTWKPRTAWVINGNMYLVEKEQPSENSFIAIASFVTAYARCYLTELILKAGEKNVLYCDTDSLFLTQQGYENLKEYIGEGELGKLEVQGVGEGITIFAPKHYIFQGKAKIKGVPSRAIKVEDNKYVVERWLRARSLLRRGLKDRVIVEDSIKELKLKYDKGVVEKDGWVKPFSLIL
jgi:hypothetical protein